MRFILYNIRYGTGGGKKMPWSGYCSRTFKTLDKITSFMHDMNPDIVGLVEVDSGSYRTGGVNQARVIAESLGHYHTYGSKYSDRGLARLMPVINKQGNAFISRDSSTKEKFHYFDDGMKKLVIELEMDNLRIFLVHLALGFRVRHHQLSALYDMMKDSDKPCIVAGDFNVFWGDKEVNLFLAASGLKSANIDAEKSFPSWAPTQELDFILHSPEIKTTGFQIPQVLHSDHLPLVYDFEIAD
ncbi:MAG: endonuclease/exonuclease/phosphatase family protein [Kiritimatiellae bacterium]|nr:endonuclease/exonuclease/phosphatase family protein [Kiritimatiellia bacterium]